MLPTWAHAYSHYMHFRCDENFYRENVAKVQRNIRKSLNGGKFKVIENDLYKITDRSPKGRRIKVTTQQAACYLYSIPNTTISVVFINDNVEYKFSKDKGEEPILLQDLSGVIYDEPQSLPKDEWFEYVFDFSKDEEPDDTVLESDDPLQMMNFGKKIYNLEEIVDLTFKSREIVCKVEDNMSVGGPLVDDVSVIFRGTEKEVDRTNNQWLIDFISFYKRYEVSENRDEQNMFADYNSYVEDTKDLIMQVKEFRVIIARQFGQCPESKEEVSGDETKEDVADVAEITTSVSEIAIEPPVEFEASINLPETTMGVQCLKVEDIAENREYKVLKNKCNVEMIKSDSEGIFIRSSNDKKNVFTCQILDYGEEVEALDYDKKFVENKPESVSWKRESNSIVKSSNDACSENKEYEQAEAKFTKNWEKFDDPFKPDPWQLHSLKFAGEKILLGHRPGFGKTINSILLAERMRNICIKEGGKAPDIYILAPDRKLCKQWVNELNKMEDIKKKHYIWSTYKHFEISQSKAIYNGTIYPEYEHLSDVAKDKLRRPIDDLNDRGTRPPEKVYCMICNKGYNFGDLEEGLVNLWKRGRTHKLFSGKNSQYRMRFLWRQTEDKIFFSCDNCANPVKYTFITGFTNKDIEYDSYEAQQGLEITDYLRDEAEEYERFYEKLLTISGGTKGDTVRQMKEALREKFKENRIPLNLEVPYYTQKGFKWHMYRAPQNCILICDEAHLNIRETDALLLQTLWKYILGCRFTILASATPVETSGSILNQLYLFSEILRTKRDYWNDVPVRSNVAFRGDFLTPWHLLRPIESGENMYDIARRMKNKFSRYNTVENIDESIKQLTVKNISDKNFKLDYTQVMNLYMGLTDEKLKEKAWIEEREGGDQPYSMGTVANNYYKRFTEEALKKLFFLQSTKREKVFPDLVPVGNGFIGVKIDKIRAMLRMNPPKSYLRDLLTADDNYKISVQGYNVIVEKTDEEYSLNQIKKLEKDIYNNKYGFMTISFQNTGEIVNTSAAIVGNYSNPPDTSGPRTSTRNTGGIVLSGTEPIKDLKWLYIHPVSKAVSGSYVDRYENIPYVPDLLGSKVLKIVLTIEDQISKGKNVMVYHKNVEMLRMCHRALAMRGHKWVNEDIDKATVKDNVTEPSSGDYKFNQRLNEHAAQQAGKRWRKLDQEYRNKQLEAYGYTNVVESQAPDYEQYQKVYEFADKLAGEIFYPIIYKNFENKFATAKERLEIAQNVNDFAFYADYAWYKPDENQHREKNKKLKKLIRGAELMKNILKGKINYGRKREILEVLKLYKAFSPEKDYEKIIYEACKPSYQNGINEALSNKIKTILNKNVWKLKRPFKYKDHKPRTDMTKKDVLKHWKCISKENLEEIDKEELKKIYEIKNDEILREQDKNYLNGQPERLETDEYIPKLHNKSLREKIREMFKIQEMRADNYESNLFESRVRELAINYYLDKRWKKAAYTSSFKVLKKKQNPLAKYASDRAWEEKNNKDKYIELYPVPIDDNLKEKVKTFVENNTLYKNDFFTGEKKLEIKDYQQIEINQRVLPSKSTFPRDFDDLKDILLFCVWTEAFFRGELNKNLKNKTKIEVENAENAIERYAEVLEHIEKNPYTRKAKGRGKFTFNGVEVGKRKDFLNEVTPRIHGMSKKDRIFFAVMDGVTVKVDKQQKYVQAFSEGYIDCLFVSPTGVVGIDYKSCSPSYMICIDPEKSAGKQDQFNGRTVRKNSHKNLPPSMRKVEYVSFFSDGLEKIKTATKEEPEEPRNLKDLEALIKSNKPQYKGQYRKLKRDAWASRKRDKLLKEVQERKEEIIKKISESYEDWNYTEDVSFDDLTTIVTLEKKIRILSSDDEKRYNTMLGPSDSEYPGRYTGTYGIAQGEDTFGTETVDLSDITEDSVKESVMPNNPVVMGEGDLRSMLVKQEIEFSTNPEVLNYTWNFAEYKKNPGINQIRRQLKVDEISEDDQIERSNMYENGATPPPIDSKRFEEDIEKVKKVDNKRWDYYFENYVNLSHVPVYNNHVFVSVEHFLKEKESPDFDFDDKYNNIYCYACNQRSPVGSIKCIHCKFDLKRGEKYLYYHVADVDITITKELRDKIKQTKNKRQKNLSSERRIKRDRLEMLLTLNSLEHQVKQYGDTTFKFSFVDNDVEKSFYKRSIREKLPEEKGGDWYKFMTEPDIEVFHKLCDKYKSEEKDRYKGEVIVTTRPVTTRQRREQVVSDGFEAGVEVEYDNTRYTIEEVDGDKVYLGILKQWVLKSELTIVEKEEQEVSDYEDGAAVDSDTDSIQSEY